MEWTHALHSSDGTFMWYYNEHTEAIYRKDGKLFLDNAFTLEALKGYGYKVVEFEFNLENE